jgi:hypothetical protein
MQPYIPFVTRKTGCQILTRHYADAAAAHVHADRLPSLKADLPRSVPLWINPAFEGFSIAEADRKKSWQAFMAKFPESTKFNDPAFLAKPRQPAVQSFATALLDECAASSPKRITIPQWPIDLTDPKFKLNRYLAEAATSWRTSRNVTVELVFPLVFTHQSQLDGKAERNKVLAHVERCLKCSDFEGIWSVDTTLADQAGTGTFEKRFQCSIKFFDELRSLTGHGKHFTAGPYWGLNLLLWARAKIDHPAIGLGATYQYHIHGRFIILPQHPNVHVALPPLRRWATYSAELKTWLAESLNVLPASHPARPALADMHNKFGSYSAEDPARNQVAHFYKEWFRILAANPPAGRAVALYQDLSAAYVLGKAPLPLLPKDEKSARRPERVAQHLMLNCL